MQSLGDRMKLNYEKRFQTKLMRRTPVIIRLDGKSFHTLTRQCEKPFDNALHEAMFGTAIALCREVQGAKLAYVQSDEISILLTDFDTLKTDAWFDYNVQKIVSVSAGMASAYFSCIWTGNKQGIFDSRAFNLPKEEVANYFIWRQKDWKRNSLNMLAQSYYSHKELHGKSAAERHEMLYAKGVNWADLPDKWKNGSTIMRSDLSFDWTKYNGIIFTQSREVIEKHLVPEEE